MCIIITFNNESCIMNETKLAAYRGNNVKILISKLDNVCKSTEFA